MTPYETGSTAQAPTRRYRTGSLARPYGRRYVVWFFTLRSFNRTNAQLARERSNYRYRRKLSIERLSSYGYIAKHSGTVSITAHGQNQIGYVADKNHAKLKTKKWDRKWRIVVYDIPDQYAGLRRQIRLVLKRAGFKKLQQSVWVFPRECEELVSLIQKESQLSQRVLYGVLEHMQNDTELRKLFGL